MPLIDVIFGCNDVEKECFEKLCKENNLTMEQGMQILIRQACDTGRLPLEYDYDSMEHVKKEKIRDDLKDCLIPMEVFISLVESGAVNDYDGDGYLSDGEYEYGSVILSLTWLKERAKKYSFVAWYNV